MKDFFTLTKEEQFDLMQSLHWEQLKSVKEIAEDFGTYPNRVRRWAQKNGFNIRDKSEAQSVALQTGKSTHPTKDTKRPEHVKKAIGGKIYSYWKNLTPEELEERAQISRENWDKLSDDEKQNMQYLATRARLETSKSGSKLEKAILEKLITQGYYVEFHKEQSLLNEKLQIDLYIPSLRVCIEVDGPTHFEDIFGDLIKVKQRDFQKDGFILNAGCCIIRIKQTKDISAAFVDNLSEQLFKILKDIKNSFPPEGSRKFVIEEK